MSKKSEELPAPPKSPSSGSDKTLIRRYRSGDEAAATSLYLRYAHRLRALAKDYCTGNYARRFDADDIVQSVFRTFFAGVRQRGYDVPPDGELWGLLMVLALNKVRNLVDYHRAGKRAVQQTASVTDLDQQNILAADENAAAFLRLVLEEQLAGMPESNQTIVRLRIEGHEVAEIAERTGRSRRTVERVLQEFRVRLSQT
ncbi:MAG TPA: sigma-70 family RNA polymerase sigma factor [Urbifossiella sp.]|jgi:RNA polymerase sigma-70 factor (ECF subfamily)|nr:sigma-70 family RNA polymerase sigma factor [Urbifossiella sp.]